MATFRGMELHDEELREKLFYEPPASSSSSPLASRITHPNDNANNASTNSLLIS